METHSGGFASIQYAEKYYREKEEKLLQTKAKLQKEAEESIRIHESAAKYEELIAAEKESKEKDLENSKDFLRGDTDFINPF